MATFGGSGMSKLQWTLFNNADAVAEAASERILELASDAINSRGIFRLVLAGGSTPEKAYQLLAKASSDWDKWEIYFGDERCLPVDNPERNSVMAARCLTSKVAIPPQQCHAIPSELGPEKAAQAYSDIVESAAPFDLVLLGMGEDGHTASLFPGHTHNPEQWTHPVFGAPKPPPERVSLSAKALGQTKNLLYLITGSSKAEAVQAWRNGEALPVSSIFTDSGEVLIDKAAYASEL